MEGRDGTPAIVLLVEDDSGDQELTRRALTAGVFKVDLRIAGNGEEAMDCLHQRGLFSDPADAPFPDLILLDLNMPKLDGREVLKQMQADERLRRIPVVILTTSAQEADIVRGYDLGCNSFITKPVALDAFVEMIGMLGSYWFQLVTLPTRDLAHT